MNKPKRFAAHDVERVHAVSGENLRPARPLAWRIECRCGWQWIAPSLRQAGQRMDDHLLVESALLAAPGVG